jgi:hypothetical protein
MSISPFVLPFLPGGWLGYAEARLDIARGHLALRSHGMPAVWRPDYAALLRDRYGIQIGNKSGGCIVSYFQKTFNEAYNSLQREAIIQRFGRDVTIECAAEARAAWEKRSATPAAATAAETK